MQEGAVGWLHTVNHSFHVVAASLWLGSLVPLLICLGDLRQPPLRYEAICALRRFSCIGHGAVACVFVTGTVNIWLILGQWPVDWTSPYQALLAAKITLVIIMIAVALVNRYVFTPRIAADEVRALGAIAHNTLIEIGLGAMVLALVAIFGLLEPI
jgi:copper resistance protein D